MDSTQFVLLLLKLFRLQCSFSPRRFLFIFLPGFPPKLAWFCSFPFCISFFSSVFPGSSDLRAVISHPAIESTQRMAHDQSLPALIYSSRKTHSASSVVALKNSSLQSLLFFSPLPFFFLSLCFVSFIEQAAASWSRVASVHSHWCLGVVRYLTRALMTNMIPCIHSDHTTKQRAKWRNGNAFFLFLFFLRLVMLRGSTAS